MEIPQQQQQKLNHSLDLTNNKEALNALKIEANKYSEPGALFVTIAVGGGDTPPPPTFIAMDKVQPPGFRTSLEKLWEKFGTSDSLIVFVDTNNMHTVRVRRE